MLCGANVLTGTIGEQCRKEFNVSSPASDSPHPSLAVIDAVKSPACSSVVQAGKRRFSCSPSVIAVALLSLQQLTKRALQVFFSCEIFQKRPLLASPAKEINKEENLILGLANYIVVKQYKCTTTNV
jgi:hypothetical protein